VVPEKLAMVPITASAAAKMVRESGLAVAVNMIIPLGLG
jgi:hypothetical protein